MRNLLSPFRLLPAAFLYNPLMGGLLQPTPVTSERESSWQPKLVGIVAVLIVAAIAGFFLRSKPAAPVQTDPYISKLAISDLKMSQAQNFVGASVTYIDGLLTNTGDKTLTHATVRVTFKDSYGQVAQIEDLPIKILQTGGPYPEAVDLAVSPLAPGQSKPFRLTFEHVSDQWNQAYPEVQLTNVSLK
jgi:hypothetical protein